MNLATEFKEDTERTMEIKFLNVDLEFESSEDLQKLIEDFGEKVSVLYHGKNEYGFNFASLETSESAFEIFDSGKTADEVINDFCNLIENLSAKSKTIWEKCKSRKFDIGFESGNSSITYQTEIKPNTIERMAKLGLSLATTIYPQQSE